MGAAATVSKDDDSLSSNSLKSQARKKNTAMVICSGCKIPLSIFKRKVSLLFVNYDILPMPLCHICSI